MLVGILALENENQSDILRQFNRILPRIPAMYTIATGLGNAIPADWIEPAISHKISG
jgi:hypothetical protein